MVDKCPSSPTRVGHDGERAVELKPLQAMIYVSILAETDIMMEEYGVIKKDLCNALYLAVDDISRDSNTGEELQRQGVLEVCLAVLFKHSNDAATTNVALYAMNAIISRAGSAAAKLDEMNGIPIIARAIVANRDDIDCQVNGIFLLAAMSQQAGNRNKMREFKILEIVLYFLQAYHSNRNIVCAGCAYLAITGIESYGNRDDMLENGCLEEIMLIMETYKRDDEINTWCAISLYNLSLQSPVVKQLVGDQDGIHILFDSLIFFKDNLKQQIFGFQALRTLIEGNERNAKVFITLRGVELCVRALRVFVEAKQVQIHCVTILCFLAGFGRSYAERVITDGGIEGTIGSMFAIKSCRELQERGIGVLYVLSQVSDDAKSKIVDSGGVDAISKAIKFHIADEKLIDDGTRALRCIGIESCPGKNDICRGFM